MRVLVAPDSFKGTYGAAAVAEAIGRGLAAAGAQIDLCPVADGGEGTMDLLVAALGGSIETVRATDPLGRFVDARVGFLGDGSRAVVEVAEASGLALVAEAQRDAEAASTAGTGELVAAAVRAGAREVLVAAGGSATTDGGCGAVEAIRAAGGLRGSRLVVLCDVVTPFEEAAAVFAPQKGADPAAVARLTARLHEQASAMARDPRGVPMTGAAGGLSGGLWAELGAELAPGARTVLDALGFEARLVAADAVVVGEGRIDAQSTQGKIVGEILAVCVRERRAAYAVVGCDGLGGVGAPGLEAVLEAPTPEAMEAAGRTIAERLAAAASGAA